LSSATAGLGGSGSVIFGRPVPANGAAGTANATSNATAEGSGQASAQATVYSGASAGTAMATSTSGEGAGRSVSVPVLRPSAGMRPLKHCRHSAAAADLAYRASVRALASPMSLAGPGISH
jgi:hypothetical protein